jgi:hypothetical protein
MTALYLPDLLAAVENAVRDEANDASYELPAKAVHVAKLEARKLWEGGERDVELIGADVAFLLATRDLLY